MIPLRLARECNRARGVLHRAFLAPKPPHGGGGSAGMSDESAAFEAFLLGLRVFYQVYGIDAPATDFSRPWETLREIAEGRLTLSNPADLAARFPAMADFLFERANRVVADDRENARRILEGLQESLGSGGLGVG